jgi:hypothetical protein
MIEERKVAGTWAGVEPFAAVKCSSSQPVIYDNTNVIYILYGSIHQNGLSRVGSDVLLNGQEQNWCHVIIIFSAAHLEFMIKLS